MKEDGFAAFAAPSRSLILPRLALLLFLDFVTDESTYSSLAPTPLVLAWVCSSQALAQPSLPPQVYPPCSAYGPVPGDCQPAQHRDCDEED